MHIKKGMILAAGFGKRLMPLTNTIPKPLLKVGNKTLLENSINTLESFGVNEIFINVHYLADKIFNYLKNKKFKCKINIIHEKNEILDTGGAILNAINNFDNTPFIVLNPDTIWNKDYSKDFIDMCSLINSKKDIAILHVVNKNKSFDKFFYGDFNLSNNILSRENDPKNYIYTGAQILSKDVFLDFNDKVFSINKVWDKLIANKKLFGFESKKSFYHVRNLEIYNELKNKFANEID